MRTLMTLLWMAALQKVSGFSPNFLPRHAHRSCAPLLLSSSSEATAQREISMDPKEAVKLFGRLAEKYIMLDPTAGMCCYSGCKDCEFRLPDGGYRMADQSAARPKWIPIYETRSVQATGREHTTKWSSVIFSNGPAVNKEEFVRAVTGLEYAPPLGGPYVGASSANLEDSSTAEALFDLLAGDKEKLTKHRMSLRLKELANGEEGINWATFREAVGAS